MIRACASLTVAIWSSFMDSFYAAVIPVFFHAAPRFRSRSPAIAGVTPEARAYTCPVPRACLMLCVERDSLRQEHRATVQRFRAAIRDLVVLVENSSLGSAADFNLAHIRTGAARGVCEVARATLEYHQAEHGC